MRRALALFLFLLTGVASAADKYVSTGGSGGTCSIGSPGALANALNANSCGLAAGDTLWVRGGTYTGAFNNNLNGSSGNPIKVRSYTGEWAKINTNGNSPSNPGINVTAGSYVWFMDLEIYDSNTTRQAACNGGVCLVPACPNPLVGGAYGPPGATIRAPGIKFINCVVHDNQGGGFGFWKEATASSELYGNIIFYNGDSQLDHGVYTQNISTTDKKYLTDNVMFNNYGHNIHGHASAGGLENGYVIKGNALIETGDLGYAACGQGAQRRNLLLGDTNTLADVQDNIMYEHNGASGPSSDLWVSEGTFPAANITFKNNKIYANSVWVAGFTALEITGNDFCCAHDNLSSVTYPSNTYRASVFPTVDDYMIQPNDYEAGRCTITAMNWDGSATISVNLSADSAGRSCGLTDTANYDLFYAPQSVAYFNSGTKITSGVYNAASPTISITMNAGLSMPAPIGTGYLTPTLRAPQIGVFIIRTTSGAATPTPTFTPSNTPTNTPTFTPPAATNTPTLTFTNTQAPTNTFTPTRTPTPTPTPNPLPASFEVENCAITAPMRTVANVLAQGGSYVDTTVSGSAVPANGGNTVCTFSVPSTTTYAVWVRLYAPATNQDSVFADVDGEGVTSTSDIFDTAEWQQPCSPDNPALLCYNNTGWNSDFFWNQLNVRQSAGVQCVGSSPPGGCASPVVPDDIGIQRYLNLTAGTHTIKFWGRDVVSGLDAIIITSDLTYDPDASLGQPTPTPGPSSCTYAFLCKNRIKWVKLPCNSTPIAPCKR